MNDIYVAVGLPKKILQRITQAGLKYECWNGSGIPPRATLLDRVRGVRGLVCRLGSKVDQELLDAAGNNLKCVSTMSVGYDHIDLKAVKARNIRVGYTPDILTDANAETTVSILLSVSRRMREGELIYLPYKKRRNN